MADNRPIGLFDSGVGGLSVFIEIKKLLPYENGIFLADQAHVPYGGKTQKELNSLCEKITKFLLKFDIKMLVVACNTASCYSVNFLRSKFKIPIIGVVPAIKPALKLSKNGRLSVLSTPATAKSNYLRQLIRTNAKNERIQRLGCKGLEDSVEILDNQAINRLLDKYIQKVNDWNSDVVILGCTHYPFLKKDIKKRLKKDAKIIDSGKAIAKRIKSLLNENNSLSSKKGKDLYFTTQNPQKFSTVASILLKTRINASKAFI